jgi:phospho-N-acetylmuramoyl-pentapeptide-transferase
LTSQLVPFDGRHAIGGWMILVSALAVAAGSNAFNLTDGSDGLAAGAGAISFGALALVAVLQHHPGVGLMPAILAGCLIGFLFYNLFPARIFMGDTGSLALGTAMVAAAITTGFLWYLPLLALVFVVETISVIAQVASFKMTGKRIIRMSPLHNHFIVSGWREMPIALYFWAGSLVAAALALALARPGSAA